MTQDQAENILKAARYYGKICSAVGNSGGYNTDDDQSYKSLCKLVMTHVKPQEGVKHDFLVEDILFDIKQHSALPINTGSLAVEEVRRRSISNLKIKLLSLATQANSGSEANAKVGSGVCNAASIGYRRAVLDLLPAILNAGKGS